MDKRSDAELASAISASDAAAFKMLYYRYYELLFAFLWRRTQNRETSLDLAQELFARVWNNREKLDAGQSLKSYLYKIANNLVIDHFRKKGVEQSYFAADPPDDASVTTDEVDFELREQIEQAVAGLPPPVRQVFQMSRFDGLKYHEIAKALEISVKTVEARMSKALASLREQLEPFL
ncbi:MAG: RNA polymerase sigma-70 factor [Deferribacteres bacterium]|nr:RNA polymerase sigma-70 factor [candidate division KSB1 bacterium]MCB9510305.1 RNA polymerase sigma-70 factor [Deferribacteres bacterium]